MKNRKLIKISRTILISRDVENVFVFFANPSYDHLWRAEINKSILDGVLELGVTASEYSYLSKKASNNLIEMKCVQFDKNKIATFETTNSSRFYLKSQRIVKVVSENTTEISYKLEFDKGIVKLATGFNLPSFIISWKANIDAKKYLLQLKRQLESIWQRFSRWCVKWRGSIVLGYFCFSLNYLRKV